MAYTPTTLSTTSTNNSSTATLAANAVFTGSSDDALLYSEVRVSVMSNVASATNGLSVQQSPDNTNWDITDTYTIAAAVSTTIVIPRQARYIRVVYTNGATLQTSFRLQTILNTTATVGSSQKPSDTYTNETDLAQDQSFNMLFNGTTWDRVRGDVTNGVDVDVTRMSALVAGAATIGSIASVTTSIVPGNAATNLGKAEDAVHATGDTGVAVWAVRSDTLAATSGTTGDYEAFHTDSLGAIWTRSSAELIDDAVFTPGTSRVLPIGHQADETATDSVDEGDIGTPRMTLDRKSIVAPQSHTNGGATPYMLISAASTNATSLKASPGQIYSIAATNINAAVRYLKIYNKASAPTVGTDTPLQVYAIPGNAAGAGLVISFPVGQEWTTGIAFALTTGVATSDTGAVAANDVVVNINYK